LPAKLARHIQGPVWEFRRKDRQGIARALYVTISGQRIVIVRVFVKKTQKTPLRAGAATRRGDRMTSVTRKKTVPAARVFAEARKRPGYAQAYDALEEEFSLVAALMKARTTAGLTQEELAKRMNTTQAVIARLEAGGRRPSTRTLERFAKATGHRLKISFVAERHERSRRDPR
jgi:ribosome-binding protein aMBF1 (putative translation factor)